jgi:hypothetical protein
MQEIINNTIQVTTTYIPSKGGKVHTDCKFYTTLGCGRCISGTSNDIIEAFRQTGVGCRVVLTKENIILRSSWPLASGEQIVTEIKVNDEVIYRY